MSQEVFTRENMFTDRTVAIRYVLDKKNGVEDKSHTLYGGLTNSAVIAIPAPLNVDGRNQISTLFTKEELQILSEELHDPTITNVNAPFWKDYALDENRMPIGKFPIYLKKEGMLLEMKDPLHYIYLKVLLASPIVAKDKEDVKYKESFRFYAVDSDKVYEEKRESISHKKKAYVEFGKIEDNREVVLFVLRAMGASIASDAKMDFLNNTLFDYMEDRTSTFLSIVDDKYLKMKIFIGKLVAAKLLNVKDELYYTSDNKVNLALDGKINNIDNAAEYLASSIGQETYLALVAGLKQQKAEK